MIPFFNGSADEAKKRFKAVLDVGPVADMTKEIPYEELNGLQVNLLNSVTHLQPPHKHCAHTEPNGNSWR